MESALSNTLSMKKLSRDVKKSPWYNFLPLYLTLISMNLFSTGGLTMDNPLDIYNLNRVGGIVLNVTIILAFYLVKKKIVVPLPLPLTIYGIYIIFGFISSFLFSHYWLGYSLFKLLQLISVLLLGFYIWSINYTYPGIAFSFYEKILSFLRLILFLAFITALITPGSLIVFRAGRIVPSLSTGIFAINPNTFGLLAAIVLFVTVVRLMNRNTVNYRFLEYFWFILSALYFVSAQSRTAVLALVFGVIVVILINVGGSAVKRIGIVSVLVALYFFFQDVLLVYFRRGQPEHLYYRLSGRLDYWEVAVDTLLAGDFVNILIGMGFALASRMDYGFGTLSTLHSDYVDALVSVGFVGTAFLVMFIITSLFRAFNINLSAKKRNYYMEWSRSYPLEFIGIIIMLCTRTITGTTVTYYSFFVIIFIVVVVCMHTDMLSYPEEKDAVKGST